VVQGKTRAGALRNANRSKSLFREELSQIMNAQANQNAAARQGRLTKDWLYQGEDPLGETITTPEDRDQCHVSRRAQDSECDP
jgi:hypothetical protein